LKTHWHTQNAQAVYDQSAIKKKIYAQKNPWWTPKFALWHFYPKPN
jgi:hypothetical protein